MQVFIGKILNKYPYGAKMPWIRGFLFNKILTGFSTKTHNFKIP